MSIASQDIAPIIGSVATLVATVLGFVLNSRAMRAQNKALDKHQQELASMKSDLAGVVAATGTYKMLPRE